MLVIVEGPDFSGKTNLVNALVHDLNARSFKSDRPESMDEVHNWVETVRSQEQYGDFLICDRSPLISEPIYGDLLRKETILPWVEAQKLLSSLVDSGILIIFCDPGEHQVFSCDNEQMVGVKENLDLIYTSYQVYMVQVPVPLVRYNFKLPGAYDSLVDFLIGLQESNMRQKSIFEDEEMACVHDFHVRFQVPMPNGVTPLPEDVLQFRQIFLQEELNEFLEAHDRGDLVKAFDALLDLTYVVKGTALMMGITPLQWSQGFEAVQKANMTKTRTPSALHSKRGHAFDVIKPEGWVGPEVELSRILGDA